MSLSLARTWIETTIKHPKARDNALRLLDQAVSERAHATLIAGPCLTPNGKPYLARWTGQELVVLEIPDLQYAGWNLDPRMLFEQLDAPKIQCVEILPEPPVTLFRPHVNNPVGHNGWGRLTGNCPYEIDETLVSQIDRAGLHVIYFHPEMKKQVSDQWVVFGSMRGPRGELCFFFNPVFSDRNPDEVHGMLVLFLQLFTSTDWKLKAGCRAVSNVTTGLVGLR